MSPTTTLTWAPAIRSKDMAAGYCARALPSAAGQGRQGQTPAKVRGLEAVHGFVDEPVDDLFEGFVFSGATGLGCVIDVELGIG